jgi:hypothetical protein
MRCQPHHPRNFLPWPEYNKFETFLVDFWFTINTLVCKSAKELDFA